MPYSIPGGNAAHFTTAEYVAPALSSLGIVLGSGYTAPAGGAIAIVLPSFVAPSGSAAHFVLPPDAVQGTGSAVVEITASGSGDGATVVAVTGSGDAAVSIVVAGEGARGVAGEGAAAVSFGVVGVAVHERYELAGEVRMQGVLVDRQVRAYRRDTGELVAEQATSGGRFRIPTGFVAREHYIVPIDLSNLADDFTPPCANRVMSALAQDAA